MIEIDGSWGEGGGQIVRSAVSLAAATSTPCRIVRIRSRREKPGLMRQHLMCIRALADLSQAELEGGELGSREITFRPRKVVARKLCYDIETAAAITLVLQGVIPAAIGAPSPVEIVLRGGATDTSRSPGFDYFRFVFLRMLRDAGIDARPVVTKRGYYPPGGAEAALTVTPGRPRAVDLVRRGTLNRIVVMSSASELLRGRRVAERQADAAQAALAAQLVPIHKQIEYAPSITPGSACCVVAEFENTVLGANQIGAPGRRAESVGADAAADLTADLATGACLDRHMADQILPYLALAEGDSSIAVAQVTRHALTNMWVVERFIDGRFQVDGNVIRWSRR
jgi:RNA 3'-terminal phosphate cyclase (ATP)